MLAAAGRVLPGSLVQADIRRLPVRSGSLDGIWCCAALLHVPEDRWFFYRRAGVLRDQLHAVGLQVLTATEELASRHWVKILAAA